ncbi:hypothetical protein AB1L42_14425 [Thalassoglobus sp. JC818]|uniref:hypothetical protein n=1 Tax=Thalassoglobus sp. JC818 TaxID=3232136 RepID=UPI00345A78E3
MSERNIQLTQKQQDLLLRGLRYVRSSIALDARDWSPEVEAERQGQYDEIARVEALLNGAKIVETATV